MEYDNIKNAGLNFAIVKKSWIPGYKSPILLSELLLVSVSSCNLGK